MGTYWLMNCETLGATMRNPFSSAAPPWMMSFVWLLLLDSLESEPISSDDIASPWVCLPRWSSITADCSSMWPHLPYPVVSLTSQWPTVLTKSGTNGCGCSGKICGDIPLVQLSHAPCPESFSSTPPEKYWSSPCVTPPYIWDSWDCPCEFLPGMPVASYPVTAALFLTVLPLPNCTESGAETIPGNPSCGFLASWISKSICNLRRCNSAHTLLSSHCSLSGPWSIPQPAYLGLPSWSLRSTSLVVTYLTSALPGFSTAGWLAQSCESPGATKGFVDRAVYPVNVGCPKESHANDSRAPSRSLTPSEGCLPDLSSAAVLCLAQSTNWSPVGATLILSWVAISSTNLVNISCWSLNWFSMASRNKWFSSLTASSSSNMDEVTDVTLYVSPISFASSTNWTVTKPRRTKSPSCSSSNDVSLAICDWYSCPWGPRHCSISSASRTEIHPMDNNASRDAVFKWTGAKSPFAQPPISMLLTNDNYPTGRKLSKYSRAKIHKWKYQMCKITKSKSTIKHWHLDGQYSVNGNPTQ